MTESTPESASSDRGWDARAATYDSVYDQRTANGHAVRSRLQAVIDLAGDGPGVVLDAGMGGGRLCLALDDRGWTVHGVDTSIEMVELGRRRLPGATERFVHGSIESLPFPPHKFDAVCATGVLEYAHVPTALRELARVLRPGGIAIVSYPNQAAVYSRWKAGVYYPLVKAARYVLRRPDPLARRAGMVIDLNAMMAIFNRAGFDVEKWLYTSYMPLVAPMDRFLPKFGGRLAERLEERHPTWAPALATQFVFRARRATP